MPMPTLSNHRSLNRRCPTQALLQRPSSISPPWHSTKSRAHNNPHFNNKPHNNHWPLNGFIHPSERHHLQWPMHLKIKWLSAHQCSNLNMGPNRIKWVCNAAPKLVGIFQITLDQCFLGGRYGIKRGARGGGGMSFWVHCTLFHSKLGGWRGGVRGALGGRKRWSSGRHRLQLEKREHTWQGRGNVRPQRIGLEVSVAVSPEILVVWLCPQKTPR